MEYKKLTNTTMEVTQVTTNKVVVNLEGLLSQKEMLEGQLKQINELITEINK